MGYGLENQKIEELAMVKKCYFCKGRVLKEKTTVDYRWGGALVVIKDVPARICQQCGEKYIDNSVYKEMERLAKDKSHLLSRVSIDILGFEGVSAH